MSFQTQGARAAKLKSMKLQASKWETIFPATSDILVVTPYHPPALDCTVWSAAAPSWTDKLTLSKLIVNESHSEGLTDLFVNPRRATRSWQHWRFWPRYLLTRIWIIINFKVWGEYERHIPAKCPPIQGQNAVRCMLAILNMKKPPSPLDGGRCL